jgi:molybdenum cofactor biosynthesis enzyme MoaA
LKDYEEIKNFILELESAGVEEVIFPSGDPDLEKHIIGLVLSLKSN